MMMSFGSSSNKNSSELSQSLSSSSVKYVPPHRRKLDIQNKTAVKTDEVQLTEPLLFTSNRSYTAHGDLRKEQREISVEALEAAVNKGVSLNNADSMTYIDQKTTVVTEKNGKVITVLDNKRNTKFDILRVSKEREKILLEKARKNNDTAMCELAELYLSGDLGNRVVKDAYNWLFRAANEYQNSHAMCLLADLYGSGDLGKPDIEKKWDWLEKAAQKDNRYALAVVAQHDLQWYLQVKDDKSIDFDRKSEIINKIRNYLKRSADKGATRAMWQMGQICEEGWFGKPSLIEAIEWYTKAAKTGSPASLSSLKRLVSEKKFDSDQFEIILNEASNVIASTSSELAVEIGLQQIRGELGCYRERGFWMLVEAAKKNNVDAIKELAKCYKEGIGCEVDLPLSQQWYQKLARLYEEAGFIKGNLKALWQLGHLYLNGNLGGIDSEKAEKIFIRAAEMDDALSCFHIGKLYIEGSLGDRDPKIGLPWIKKGIALIETLALEGDLPSIKRLIHVYLDKEKGFKNYELALKWLLILAKKSDKNAMLRVAMLYLKHKFQGKSIKEGVKWLLLASESIDCQAGRIAAFELEKMLSNKNWFSSEKEEFISAVLEYAQEFQGQQVFRIGRILGDVYSQNNLTQPNYKKAAYWYEKSGACQNSQALLRMGDLYCTEAFGKIDLIKAVDYFKLSASLGSKTAKQRIIDMDEKVESLDIEKKIVVECLENKEIEQRSIENFNISDTDSNSFKNEEERIDSITLLENLYQMGLEKKTTDPKQAALLLKKASDFGFANASFELGELYSSGSLGNIVRPVAILFYKRAAKHNKTEAADKLAIHYTTGTLIAADPVKADKWKRRSGLK